MNIVQVFSENVRYYRQQKGFTQEELAFKSDLHRTYIGDVECERRSISLKNIQKIADALGIDSYKLLVNRNK